MAMPRFLSHAPVFLAFPPPPPLLMPALNLPCKLAATADALLGMVYSDLFLLLLLDLVSLRCACGHCNIHILHIPVLPTPRYSPARCTACPGHDR
jgi:hypothetical protein